MCSIRDAAATRDYHELDYSDAEDPHAVEKRLAEIEGYLSRTLTDVVQSGITSAEVHARLIELVALMQFRVPAFKAYIEESLHQVVRSFGKIMERKGALPPIPKGFEDILRMDRIDISISNWKCLEYMFGLAADPDVLGLLLAMTPSILRAQDGEFLLTCDQPVSIFHPEASVRDPYGKGVADPRSELSFPLTSQVLLRLTWDKRDPKDRALTAAEVTEFNRRTVVMADALVFASDSSEAAVAFVAQHRHCSAGPELQVIEAGDSHLHMTRFRPVMLADRYT